jgi:tetratricopeptide (TPR) repeat protein
MAKYVAGAAVAIAVTEYVRVEVPFGSLVAVLTLAELYQANGRHDEAIGLLQQLVELDPDPALVLSLCVICTPRPAPGSRSSTSPPAPATTTTSASRSASSRPRRSSARA